MNTQTRIGMALAGIVVLIVAALLVASLSDDDDQGAAGSPPSGGTAATGETGADTGSVKAEPVERPDLGPLIVAGKLRRIEADKGETVRFRALSKSGDELHIHGYDLYVDLPAGDVVNYRFRATLDGLYVIEMHDTGEQVAELRVNP